MNANFDQTQERRECECCDGFAHLETRVLDYQYGHAEDATTIKVDTPVWVCDDCGSIYTADGAEEAQHAAICEHLNRMRPADIAAGRQRAGLTQGMIAEKLGVSRVTVARWETSRQIQTSSHDARLRDLLENFENRPVLIHEPIFRTDIDSRRHAAQAFSLAA